jgi:hypothetical protein
MVTNRLLFIFSLWCFCFQILPVANHAQVWQSVGQPGISDQMTTFTSLAFSADGTPHILISGQSSAVSVMKYMSGEWVSVGETGFFDGAAESYGALAISPSDEPHVALRGLGWEHAGRASVLKYDGTQWQAVGNLDFSEDAVDDLHIQFGLDGTPYVAFADHQDERKARVRKLEGNEWVSVGDDDGVSLGAVLGLSFAFSPDGDPHVAFSDEENGYKATVRKFNGTDWETVGTPGGLSTGFEMGTSLAFSPFGELYVSYQDAALFNRPTVIKFDGDAWQIVGSPGFSLGNYVSVSPLSFSPAGEPYVVFRDITGDYGATVMKYDGSQWTTVGNSHFSHGAVQYPTIAFGQDGNPYVAFQDAEHGNKTTVMTLNIPSNILSNSRSQVTLYPNPTSDLLTIQTPEELVSIGIYDATGTMILTEKHKMLSIAHLASGVYFVEISTASGRSVHKLLIQ